MTSFERHRVQIRDHIGGEWRDIQEELTLSVRLRFVLYIRGAHRWNIFVRDFANKLENY